MKLNQKTTFYIFIITIIAIAIYYTFIKKEDYLESNYNLNILTSNEENSNTQDNSLDEKSNDVSNKIVIYITGTIKNEGVYELEENSRIADSIEKAGGLTEEANINNINLAYVLQDGMKVYIPKKGESVNEMNDNTNVYVSREESVTKNSEKIGSNSNTDKININTATQKELETLPGIGEATAVKIINYRNKNGKFSCIEDIKKVSGIGDSKYYKIKDLIRV